MAWIDDRVWCHPKLTDASDASAWTWVKSIAYSSGFNTGGRLTPGQQKAVGASPRVRRELLERGLWNEAGGDITIHDWADHNSKRDARRAADRERKRQERRGQSAGTSAGRSAGQSGGNAAEKVADRRTLNARRRAPDDGSEGSDGSEGLDVGEGSTVAVNAHANGNGLELDLTPDELQRRRQAIAESLQEAS